MGWHELYTLYTLTWLAWLMQTAKDHDGDVQTEGYIDPAAARTGRLKGHDRRRAKEAGTPTNIQATSDAILKKYVTTEEILRQGIFLASLDVTFTMPQNVARCYKAALSMRERYAEWYDNDPTADPRDNEGHRYFNSVMREVERLLKGRILVQPISSAASQPVPSSAGIDPLPTLFENLKLADPTTDDFHVEDEEASTSIPEATVKKPRTNYVPKLSKEEEMRMKWISIFEEASCIWIHNLRMWLRLRDKNSPLDAGIASFVVESAIALFGFQEEEFYREAESLDSNLVLQMESKEDKLLHIPLITLREVSNMRKQRRTGYMLPMKPLNIRHPDIKKAASIATDTIIVQWMSELYVESAIRQDTWQDRDRMLTLDFAQPLLGASLDYLSEILQSVNEGGVVHIQTALAAQTIHALRVTAPDYGHAFKHLFAGLIDFERQKKNVFPRLAHLEDSDIFQKLRTVVQWVNRWPGENARDDEWALQANDKVELDNLVGAIAFPKDGIFLRRTNPVLVGKLRLCFSVLREEAGLELVNTGPHVLAMCHLYNALLQTGRISPGTSAAGNLFEKLSGLHMQELFMGSTFPTGHEMHVRLRLAWGTSLSFVKQGKMPVGSSRPLRDAEKLKEGKWRLETSPAIKILRDYLHGRTSLVKALASFHEEFQKGVRSREQIPFNKLDIVEFLDKLLECLEESYPRLIMDYFTAHCACTELLQKIDAAIGSISLVPQVAPEAWKEGTDYAYAMASQLLRDLEKAEDAKAKNRKNGVLDGTDESTLQLDLTTAILQEYLDTKHGDGLPG